MNHKTRFQLMTALLLSALLLTLCACGGTNADPLPFLDKADDSALMTDDGVMQLSGGAVQSACLTLQQDGKPRQVTFGTVCNRRGDTPAPLDLTAGQFRQLTAAVLAKIPQAQGSCTLQFWPQAMTQGVDAFPCWTYSLSGQTLTEGLDPAYALSHSRLHLNGGTEPIHILIKD